MTDVFISYSHRDKWLHENDLSVIPFLQRQFSDKGINFWYDPELSSKHIGDDYRKIIVSQIRDSKFAIIFISYETVVSKFIKEVEIPLIKELYESGSMRPIPILLEKLKFDNYSHFLWLNQLQIFPAEKDPLINYWTENDLSKKAEIKNRLTESLTNVFFPLIISSSLHSESTIVKKKHNKQIYLRKIFTKYKKKLIPTFILVIIALSILLILNKQKASDRETTAAGNEMILINRKSTHFSFGGDEKTEIMSGSVIGVNPDNYRIVVFAYTNQWYIQPDVNNYLINIQADGSWSTETHLGEKYCIMLVKKNFSTESPITSLPLGSDKIIAIKYINL